MNTELRDSIVRHIFSGFGILPSSFINLEKTKSLTRQEFLLDEKIPFTMDDGSVVRTKVWGCQTSAESKEIRFLLADCSQEPEVVEYALLISMQDSPTYGVYLIDDQDACDTLVACSMDSKSWMECQTYLQATFLAGMEQIKEISNSWTKCTNYKSQFSSLLSFIKFHNLTYETRYL